MTVARNDKIPEDAASADANSADLRDTPISCIDCSLEFIWTVGEQEFFRAKGLVNPPKRCKTCKKAKNERIEAVLAAGNGERARVIVNVKCDLCGQATTVPFFPSQGRPVYCRDCFKTKPPAADEQAAT